MQLQRLSVLLSALACFAASILGTGVFGGDSPAERFATGLSNPSKRALTVAENRVGHPALMSPHGTPIAISANRLFVVNTPADTLDVIDPQTRQVIRRIPVGIDPVSLAIRPDGKEVWVANHVSDSVSVIANDPDDPLDLTVVATIQSLNSRTRATRFDEPVGIAFANDQKAYVALSSENRIAVVDVVERRVRRRLTIPAQDPRQLLVHAGRLYVIPFESNNQTQLSGGNAEDIDGDLVTFDAWDHSIANNNVLSIGHVVDIVKHPEVPDRDLFVFDTETDELIETVDTLGTLLYGIAVDSEGRIYVAQTDARNDVNGRAGTKGHGLKELENRPFLNRVTRVAWNDSAAGPFHSRDEPDGPHVEFIDLEPVPPAQPQRGAALATPYAIVFDPASSKLLVSAAGSDKIALVDPEQGTVVSTVAVGSVPRGITLSHASGRGTSSETTAWVYNAVDNSVSIVQIDSSNRLQCVGTIALEDPTEPVVKRGRKLFNSAAASSTGTFSCASCHPDGHTDQLLWVLKTPVVTGGDQIMPRSTMPVRGLRDTEPFHWDGIPGDPYGGINSAHVFESVPPNCEPGVPESAMRHLIDGALATTMLLEGDAHENDAGSAGYLSEAARNDLARFLLAIPYPPAQRRAYTNELSETARRGFELFHVFGDRDPGRINNNVCGDCHRMPLWVSTNTPGTGMDAPTWRGAYDRWLILPQGRLNIVEFPFFRRVAQEGLDERRVWQFSWAGRRRFDPVWNMVLEGSTGFSGAFARQATLDSRTAELPETLDLIRALEQAAQDRAIVLRVTGALIDGEKSNAICWSTVSSEGRVEYVATPDSATTGPTPAHADSLPDIAAESRLNLKRLIDLAKQGRFVGTWTAHVGDRTGYAHPQPLLWASGPIHAQTGHQEFPIVYPSKGTIRIRGRHVESGANLVVDGHRVKGRLSQDGEDLIIDLDELPQPGMHLLQVQNPRGMFSNDFIFYVAADGDSAVALRREIELERTDGRTALVDAAWRGDRDLAEYLLDHGADVNALHPESGGTALTSAALRGNLAMVELLLDRGADVSRKNRDGNSALHIAAFMCHFKIVDRLLEHGASVDMKNSRGETAIDGVSGEWSEQLSGIYQFLSATFGLEIDLNAIRKSRPRMRELLRSATPAERKPAGR